MGLLARIAGRLNLRQPAPPWLHPFYVAQMGGSVGLAASAEPVTPRTAQGQATCYSCLALISGAIAAPAWEIARASGGGRVIERNTPAARALTSLDFSEREGVVWDCWSTGNAMIRKWTSRTGALGELERMVASQVTIQADAAGVTRYRYADPYSGKTLDLGGDDVIHVRCRTLALWPAVGVPPLLSGKDAIGLALAIQRYQGSSLANASVPAGYLATSGKIDEHKAAALVAKWREAYATGANSGKTAILEQGLEYKTVPMTSLKDLQLIEAAQMAAVEVAKLFNLPASAVGESGNVNRSTAGVELELMYRLCLFPASVRVSDQVGRQLLSEQERAGGYSVSIDLQEWLRGAGQSLADMLSKLVLCSVITPDEARSFINLPAAANGDGAILLRPLNMVPADQSAVPVPAAASSLAPASSPSAAAPPLEVRNVISFPEPPKKDPAPQHLGRTEKLLQIGILENLTRAFGMQIDIEALTGPAPMSPEEVELLVAQRVAERAAVDEAAAERAAADWLDEFERAIDEEEDAA